MEAKTAVLWRENSFKTTGIGGTPPHNGKQEAHCIEWWLITVDFWLPVS